VHQPSHLCFGCNSARIADENFGARLQVHIGLAVDDFEAAVTELRAKGVQFIVEPTDVGSAKFTFIQGAAGTTLEILQVKKQN
jgi:hypothetical protein